MLFGFFCRGGQFERDNHPVYGAKLVVQSNGLVMHVPEVEVSFSCRFDLTWFPFDTQYCKIELLSWIHSKQEVGDTKISRCHFS